MDLLAAVWQKSNRSGPNGCVEVAFANDHVAVRDSKYRDGPVLLFTPTEWEAFLDGGAWQKSGRSGMNGCVEVAFIDDQVAVRDSKHKDGPVLVFTPREWEAFLGGIADGQFRLPVQKPLD